MDVSGKKHDSPELAFLLHRLASCLLICLLKHCVTINNPLSTPVLRFMHRLGNKGLIIRENEIVSYG